MAGSIQGFDSARTINGGEGYGYSRLISQNTTSARFPPYRRRLSIATTSLPLLLVSILFAVTNPASGLIQQQQQQQPGAPFATSFYFTSFNASTSNPLTFLRDAFVDTDQIYLTSKQISTPTETMIVPLSHGIGRAFYPDPIRGRDPITGRPTSFSTTFIFSIVNPQQLQIGDGLAFLITANDSIVGSGGEYLGALDQKANGSPSAHTVAVEFDTWQNPQLLDLDGNHVGVDVDSMISQQASTAGFWGDGDGVFHLLPLTGLRLQAWIDFSGASGEIEVRISPLLEKKPARPLLSAQIDLTSVMEDEMFVGFAAATGDLSAEHIIHAWSFNTSGPARELELESDSGSNKQKMIIRWICVGAGSLTAAMIGFTSWILCSKSHRWRRSRSSTSSSKVHVGDPEAVVLPADRIRDAARAQANLNISKVLAETHMRALAEER